jgi:hypothetical protein
LAAALSFSSVDLLKSKGTGFYRCIHGATLGLEFFQGGRYGPNVVSVHRRYRSDCCRVKEFFNGTAALSHEVQLRGKAVIKALSNG